jgi:hypothetical protein
LGLRRGRGWAPAAVAQTRGRGAQRLGRGDVWCYLIAWGGALGDEQRLEAWFNSEVLSLARADSAGTRVKLRDRRLGDGQLSVALWHTRRQPVTPWHGGVAQRSGAAVLQWSVRSRAMAPHAHGS